jgi:hypothetical protein
VATGSNGGFIANPRDGTGTSFTIYNPTGDDLRVFGSADIVTIAPTRMTLPGGLTLNGAEDVTGSWVPFTFTPTPQSGAFGSVSGSGRYLPLGKTRVVEIDIQIPTPASATGAMFAPLPFTTTGRGSFAGRERAAAGFGFVGNVEPNQLIVTRDSGSLFVAGGRYQATFLVERP